MVTQNDISKLRIIAQQLHGNVSGSAAQLVHYFGAMQAQDYSMCKWAVGARVPVPESEVESAINAGQIIRTHVLRPTWHLVSAADVHWMLQLTAPHIRKAYLTMGAKLGVDSQFLNRSNKTIYALLKDRRCLTRAEIMANIKMPGEMTNDLRPSIIMMHAELEGIVCNGPMRGKDFTYALLSERVPHPAAISRDNALSLLAERYFTSHGPATAADFAWWSGLPVAAARQAVAAVEDKFESLLIGDLTYLIHKKHLDALHTIDNTIHLLPAFDEFLISYKDRTASIPVNLQKHAFTVNGIFKPIIVLNGQVVGIWKRTVKKDTVTIESQFFMKIAAKDQKQIVSHFQRYANFLDKKAVVL